MRKNQRYGQYGRQHAFYVQQVGPAADEEVRDLVVQAMLRSRLTSDYVFATITQHPMLRAQLLQGLAAMVTVTLFLIALVYAASSLRARARADAATALSGRGRLTLAGAAALSMALGDALLCRYGGRHPTEAGGVLGLLLLLALPLLASRWSRTPGARLGAAWRGNLRRVAPLSLLLCAVLAIGLALAGRQVRGRWLKEWHSPNYSEMAAVRDYLGARWTNPPIPKDAWRAEYPKPLPPAGGGGRGGRGRM